MLRIAWRGVKKHLSACVGNWFKSRSECSYGLCYHTSVRGKLYLVDGMSHLYRAYYAIRGLSSKSGRPTNAIYGFTNMLRKLIEEEKPAYLAVAMDTFGPTVRHEQFESYKATRRPMPDDLREQVPYLSQVCQVLRVPVISYPRYEADDVIGTLASKAAQAGLEVVIVTIDKDMFQLVNDRITVLDTRQMKRLDSRGVEAKFGVLPPHVTDVLSLVGDSSDNIPGAPGIGAKGARQLIAQFGSLNELLARRDEVKRKTYRESLQQHEPQIRQSRELVTIHCDLDLELDLEELRLREPEKEATRQLFSELEFESLIPDYLPSSRESESHYEEAVQLSSLRAQLNEPSAALAWDEAIEEGGGALGLSHGPSSGYWLPRELVRKERAEFERLLTAAQLWCVHDFKTMLLGCWKQHWPLPATACDTMLMAYLLQPNQNDYSLEKLASDYLGLRLEPVSEGLFDDSILRNQAERADLTLRLYHKLQPLLVEQGLQSLLEEIEMPLEEVLASMEQVGVRLDCKLLKKMSEQMESTIASLSQRIFELADEEFNLNSPKQLAGILFEKLGLPLPKKTRKAGHYATGVEVLERLAAEHEIARQILEYRELSKLKNTYLDALPKLVDPETSRIHTSYNQMVASTGRLSSSNPNLQNIPVKSAQGREIRRAFVAEPGFRILAADYSQIELRVMAHLSRDPVLMDAFARGEDIHQRTAREVFGMGAIMDPGLYRRHAKVINFGIMYGLSAFGLAQNLKISRKEAQQFIDSYFQRYQGVKAWIDETLAKTRQSGMVSTLLGRIRQIPEIHSKNWNLRSFGERTAINAPIQGSAADLIKKAMVAIHRELQRRQVASRLILQVHDELILEVAESEIDLVSELVKIRMEQVEELNVPLKVDMALGHSWYEAK